MKIVDIAEFYAPTGGGVRSYVNRKFEVAARLGHQLVVIAPGAEDREESRSGGRIVWVRGPPLPVDPGNYRMFWHAAAAFSVLDREKPDIIEGSSPWRGGWIAANWPGQAARAFVFHQDFVAAYAHTFLGRHIGTARVDRLFGWYWKYLRRLSERFDATIASGDWLARKLSDFGLHRPVAIPFGIDEGTFSPRRRDPALRARLLAACGLPESATLLLSVSRFHPEKRLHTVIGGFARASAGQPMGLVIVGDGGWRRWVERRVRRVEGVHLAGFLGDRDELAATYASADYFVHGSAAETYGLVLAEAISSGLPLVVPDTGGAADLAAPGYAELYTPGDATACAHAITRLLARDRDGLISECAQAAEHHIGSADDHFQALFRFYEELIGDS